MDLKLFATVFITVFLAEIADKTQVATLLYATNTPHAKLTVFLASALALAVASGLAVLAGSLLGRWIDGRYVAWIAGSAFILVGLWTLVRA